MTAPKQLNSLDDTIPALAEMEQQAMFLTITRQLGSSLADSIELILNDLVGGKRSRTRRYTRTTAPKVIIVKVPR